MKKLLLIISFMFLASCVTQHVFNAEEANTYLMSHKERPVGIQEALSVGKLTRGMNEEEVKICWGKPDSIEKSSMPNHEISYIELSTHTSGLPSTINLLFAVIFGKMDSSPYKDFTEEKLIHYLKNDLKLVRRGKVSYSNIGIGLLGYILSKYSHQSYDQLLKQNLLDPLNMTDTTTIRKDIKGKLVAGLGKKLAKQVISTFILFHFLIDKYIRIGHHCMHIIYIHWKFK